MRFGMFVKIMALIVGVMQCIVGVIQLFESFNVSGNTSFCDSLPESPGNPLFIPGMNKESIACIGPQIRWVKGDGYWDFTSNVNGKSAVFFPRMSWRGVFSFKPEVFVDLWTPMLFGVISVFLHMGQTRSTKIADNWLRFSFWFLIQACWGSFGYAGNIGIITGFWGIAVSFFALIAICVAPNEQTALDLHGVLGMLHVDGDTTDK